MRKWGVQGKCRLWEAKTSTWNMCLQEVRYDSLLSGILTRKKKIALPKYFPVPFLIIWTATNWQSRVGERIVDQNTKLVVILSFLFFLSCFLFCFGFFPHLKRLCIEKFKNISSYQLFSQTLESIFPTQAINWNVFFYLQIGLILITNKTSIKHD